ncbi:MAG: hypothetical protein ACOX19_12880 [Fermentimonas sp.]
MSPALITNPKEITRRENGKEQSLPYSRDATPPGVDEPGSAEAASRGARMRRMRPGEWTKCSWWNA